MKLLQQIDKSYIPKISSQVNLSDYCDKLISKATVFVANINKKDVGLLAIYLNNIEAKTAFISSIGVLTEYRKYKVGQLLIELAITHTKNKEFYSISLEVNRQNIRAIRFYEKNNFVINQASIDNESFYMTRRI
ncbi:GNAT family N-acetyltransferase [Pontibacter sp. BT731]|uniref:GNAT family N-acetyltransferase n=1 Tax=Pontibacter coccineus TaxID=3063328 RepID=UPI0026E23FD2|nr:GNAT family N-acetyltransferase [Pontibacter sp. BT731]MDO6390230.1 GNAT family N-acetyltransferase [Pontibacter sp. BT731]